MTDVASTQVGTKWKQCAATPSRQIEKVDCERISRTREQSNRWCAATQCQCPWRYKPGAVQQKKSTSHSREMVIEPTVAKFATVPATPTAVSTVSSTPKARWQDLATRAKHAFATKRHMRVDPETCFPMQGKRGQPRKIFTKRGLDKLRRSLIDVGQIHPAFVRLVGTDRREIFAGERRWRCIKMIPGMQYEIFECDVPDDDLLPFMMAVICDSNQEALSPLEKCDAIRQLWDAEEMEIEDIAEMFGLSVQKAKDLAQLTHLCPQLRAMLDPESEDPLPELAAIRIAKKYIGDTQSQIRAAQMFMTGELKLAEIGSENRSVNLKWASSSRGARHSTRRSPTTHTEVKVKIEPHMRFAGQVDSLRSLAEIIHRDCRSQEILGGVQRNEDLKRQILKTLEDARRYVNFARDIIEPTE